MTRPTTEWRSSRCQASNYPDELNVNNYGDNWTSIEHIQNSPEVAHRPLGVFIDLIRWWAAREADASPVGSAQARLAGRI